MVIAGSETKTGSAIEFIVPDPLRPHLDDYLSLIRPRLLGNRSCPALWVRAEGCAPSYSAIGPMVGQHTEGRLGLHIAPHDVRDAAVTLWVIADPAHIGVARMMRGQIDQELLEI